MMTTDPRCGKTYRANDTDGHCTRCHRTFVGERAFTEHHRHLPGGELVCEDPKTAALSRTGKPKYGVRERPGTTDGVAYGIGPSGAFSGGKPWE